MPAHDPAPKLMEIFNEALELASTKEQIAYLDGICGADRSLFVRLEKLLRAHVEDDGFLESPAAAPTVDVPPGDLPAPEGPGLLIGPYKLLENIGEGGMGTVYMAEQTDPIKRRVALKVIKPGMDSKQVVARFEAERQALAMMDHPNIARVFDGGMTPAGRPYFVMELVDGLPINEYCDREQLSIPERLDLFVLVCRAVQHAHQKGIIHRDIKPSNVLVTVIDGAPTPKVIDFGVAKATGQALTDKTLHTAVHQFVGTPLYASPEQADLSAGDVDTRSDIYSLGVLLYELLTGTTPFDSEALKKAAFDEMRRIIREDEPPKPSTRLGTLGERLSTVSARRKADPKRLGSAMRGELDWVVMKALEKDRRRRYETASDFAADVMRYLTDRPVEAFPPSSWYRFTKFARRNRAVLVTTVLVASSLIAGTVVSFWQARANHRELLVQQILRILWTPHSVGWTGEVDRRVAEAVRLGPDEDRRLQGYAAASLGGLDARMIKTIPMEAAALAFAPCGKTLYLGDTKGQVWVWDGSANPIRKIGTTGLGTFAFRPDGTAVQLLSAVEKKPVEFELRELESAKSLRRFTSPVGSDSTIGSITLTPDASFVAATIEAKAKGFAVAWSVETGEIVRQVEIDGPTSLSLSPDGRWLAVGTASGEVAIWPLPEGDPLPRLVTGRMAVTTLAFGADRLRRVRPARPGDGWLLAVGDAAAGLTLFEVGTQMARSRCRGSNYEVRSTAFRPDGMLLGSAGRADPILWDVATGHPILRLGEVNTATAMVFSPDGKRVAVSSKTAFGNSGGVIVYELENGRGLKTLWGLDAEIEKTIFSRDGALVAALAQDFRVGIWDLREGHLIHIFEVPLAAYADNAGLTFSPDGGRFTFAAGTQVKMWDIGTGEVLKTWELAAGFQDNLAFQEADRLISTRVETPAPSVPPFATDPVTYPRIVRVRDLSKNPPELLLEIPDFNLGVLYSEVTRDGRSLLIEGLGGPRTAPVRLLKAFDLVAAHELWTIQDSHPEIEGASFHFDPTGRFYVRRDPEWRVHLLEFPSRALLETYERNDPRAAVICLSPNGRLGLFNASDGDNNRFRLWAPLQNKSLLVIANDVKGGGKSGQFNLDGSHAIWSNRDGTVTVFNTEESQRRLANFGLGW